MLIRLDEVDSLVSIIFFCQIIFCTKGLTLLKKFSKSTISTDKEKKSKIFHQEYVSMENIDIYEQIS